MGLSIDRLNIATNQNDILHRCLKTGAYQTHTVLPSISPSMDIQVSSNFERALFYAYDRDGVAIAQNMSDLKSTGGFKFSQGVRQKLVEDFGSGRVSDSETSTIIAERWALTGEMLCPHSAVGVKVADEMRNPVVPMVTLATAHPAKFPDAVQAAITLRPALPRHMEDLLDRAERVTRVANDLPSLQQLIKERIAH